MNKVLVVLEQREGILREASLAAWNHAASLAGDASLTAILLGPVGKGVPEGCLAAPGTLLHLDDPALALYEPERYSCLIAEAAAVKDARLVIMADTSLSRDLAPRLALRMQAPLLQGCLDLQLEAPSCTRPVYAGRAEARIFPRRFPVVCTLALPGGGALKAGGFSFSPSWWHPGMAMDRIASIARGIAMHAGGPDITDAHVVVAGGRGMGGPEGFAMLERLAGLLGGAVGASRSAVDEGWRPHGEQIGQTGKRVSPRLYLACGISGAVQHQAGIDGAASVVALNSDPHAPIFSWADYGMVADLHQALPLLIAALEDVLREK